MELNRKKSSIMWFMPRHCRHSGSVERPDIVINNKTLQATAKQKYLGLIFDNRLPGLAMYLTSVKRCHIIFV